jgi:cysteinyl-tRNA synthetase
MFFAGLGAGIAAPFAVSSDARAQIGQPSLRAKQIHSSMRWAAQYVNVSVEAIAASDLDLVIVEPMIDSALGIFLPSVDVARMRSRPDGRRRIVLAYLSVGELDMARYYWQPELQADVPGWVGHRNPNWPGSCTVRFWDREWQSLLFGHEGSMLERIMDAGFDGVVLDRVDAYDDWRDELASAEAEMAMLVCRLAEAARATAPEFLVMPLNAERLLTRASYRDAIDGVVKESMLYGLRAPGVENAESDVSWSRTLIEPLQRDGKIVLCIEYLEDLASIVKARTRHVAWGQAPFFTHRLLDRLPGDPAGEFATVIAASHNIP